MDFSEFINYCLEREKRLQVLFHDIDVNNDGLLDEPEIIDAFKRLGISIDTEEANKLIKKIKDDGTVSITFEEWRDYLMLHPANTIVELMNFWKHTVREIFLLVGFLSFSQVLCFLSLSLRDSRVLCLLRLQQTHKVGF